jgi:hypothetical protein
VFIVDDALTFPARGLALLFREIHKAALQERDREADAIRAELSRLYLMLETNRLTEREFEKKEQALLDRLERIESADADPENPSDAED